MKRILAWTIIILIIVSTIIPFIEHKREYGYVGDESEFRTANEIDSDLYIYLDDEAIALSNTSDMNTELRMEAIKAYNYINNERNDEGLDSLSWDQNLEATSMVRAQECSISFSHIRPNGKAWYTVNSGIQGGENLAYGFNDAKSTVDAWMDSPSHRDNILQKDFNKMTISIYESDDGIYYWAEEFEY